MAASSSRGLTSGSRSHHSWTSLPRRTRCPPARERSADGGGVWGAKRSSGGRTATKTSSGAGGSGSPFARPQSPIDVVRTEPRRPPGALARHAAHPPPHAAHSGSRSGVGLGGRVPGPRVAVLVAAPRRHGRAPRTGLPAVPVVPGVVVGRRPVGVRPPRAPPTNPPPFPPPWASGQRGRQCGGAGAPRHEARLQGEPPPRARVHVPPP